MVDESKSESMTGLPHGYSTDLDPREVEPGKLLITAKKIARLLDDSGVEYQIGGSLAVNLLAQHFGVVPITAGDEWDVHDIDIYTSDKKAAVTQLLNGGFIVHKDFIGSGRHVDQTSEITDDEGSIYLAKDPETHVTVDVLTTTPDSLPLAESKSVRILTDGLTLKLCPPETICIGLINRIVEQREKYEWISPKDLALLEKINEIIDKQRLQRINVEVEKEAETEHPTLAQILRHNQAEWRKRKRFPVALSSPVEYNFHSLTDDPLERVFKMLGKYIDPAHREVPPLLGISVLSDTTIYDIDRRFYVHPTKNYKYHGVEPFVEVCVNWLGDVALGQSPIKEDLLKSIDIRLLTASTEKLDIYESFQRLVRSGKYGLEEVTEAIAMNHFQGDSKKIDQMMPELFPGYHSFQDYLERKAQFSSTAEERKKRKSRIPELVLRANMTAISLKDHIIYLETQGMVRIPGIVNIYLAPELLNGALIAISAHGPLGVISLSLGALTIASVGRLKASFIHEIIHALGQTRDHDQGISTKFELRDFKEMFGSSI